MVDIKRTLEAKEIRESIFSDPDLPESLRLFALAALHLWETQPERKAVKEFRRENWTYRTLRLMGRTGTIEELTPGLRHLLYDDVPKYRPDMNARPRCLGTMLRPAGAPCTREVRMRTMLVNPMTGERTQVGACKDERHQAQTNATLRAARQAWEDNGSPEPKANSGGRLLRYFPRGLEELYAWVDSYYTRGTKTPEPKPPQNIAGIVSLADHRNQKDT
ncbi:hypothetical protein ACFY9N_11630 [Microbacterium sp. NPDC008134]|uniref:hypothetical protein n=1 Tax=Microbacterium sp. NPDC008134 TaxID=3364183 RepID=UPI0036E34371